MFLPRFDSPTFAHTSPMFFSANKKARPITERVFEKQKTAPKRERRSF
jgi:hypothetical protein